MGQSVFPAASAGGGIKSVQRGVASASGNVTITLVDIAKSYVNSFSNGSSGAAPGTGSVSMTTGLRCFAGAPTPRDGGSIGMGGGTWSGGTTTLLTAVNGAYLSNSTTLVVTGPCYWEVVEMN